MGDATRKGVTHMVTFSVYPSTAENIRSVSDQFGSVGRAIQVAIELLYERARNGKLFDDQDDDVIDSLRGLPNSVLKGSHDKLKVPFAFSILDRTEGLLKFLADPQYYGNRNSVIMSCGTLLLRLYSDFVGNVLTPAERHQRWNELNAKLDAKAEAILGVDPKEKSNDIRPKYGRRDR